MTTPRNAEHLRVGEWSERLVDVAVKAGFATVSGDPYCPQNVPTIVVAVLRETSRIPLGSRFAKEYLGDLADAVETRFHCELEAGS